MKKHTPKTILRNIEIIDAASEGKAIAKSENLIIFVPFVVPGDVVDIEIFSKKKNYAEGKAVFFHHLSPQRTEAQCPHFGVCGGCKWQNMKYEFQLHYKQKQVIDALERIGKIDTSHMRPICGSDSIYHYRNKLEFTFSNRAWLTVEDMNKTHAPETLNALGFHIPRLFDKVLDIKTCLLQKDPSNDIRLAVKEYAIRNNLSFYDIRNHTGFLRNLIIRTSNTDELMVILAVAEDNEEETFKLLDYIYSHFPQITSLQWVLNTKLNDTLQDLEIQVYKGNSFILEKLKPFKKGMDELQFKISPKSFYQTNSEQAYKLYSFVAEFADFTGNETLYDLYTGTGTIANFVAPYVQKAIGVEYVEEAIEDAKQNARLNHQTNTQFFVGDMAKIFTSDFIASNGEPDTIITDPPRSGMHAKVIEQLLQVEAPKIIYVSCNPSTQARDIELLSAKYKVNRIQPVDMFPHTQHVENVAELIIN